MSKVQKGTLCLNRIYFETLPNVILMSVKNIIKSPYKLKLQK